MIVVNLPNNPISTDFATVYATGVAILMVGPTMKKNVTAYISCYRTARMNGPLRTDRVSAQSVRIESSEDGRPDSKEISCPKEQIFNLMLYVSSRVKSAGCRGDRKV